MTAAERFWLDLEPADTLFFRDHGARRPGVGNWAGSVPPSPLTLFGAIGSWLLEGLGVDFAAFKKEGHKLLGGFSSELRELPWSIAGPFWGEQGMVYFPAPASAYFREPHNKAYWLNKYAWLVPAEERGLFSGLPDGLRPLVFADGMRSMSGKDFKPAQGWVSLSHLECFLQNGRPESFRHHEEDKFSCAETRFGIGINENTFAADAENGMFFVTPRMRVRQGKVFSLQVRFAAEDARAQLEEILSKNSAAFFGGERGRVTISLRKNAPLIQAPSPAVLAEKGRFFLYLCTPSLFEEGWRPKQWPACFSGAELIGAAVHKPCRISGWSHETEKGKPRRLFHAAPGGSVYYFEAKDWDESKFAALIEQYHFSKSISDYYPCAGFGITCIGTWNEGGSHAA